MATPDPVETAYAKHYAAVHFIAAVQFRIPAADADQLVHDVFLAFLRHHETVGDSGAWLVASARNACISYWRKAKPTEGLPPSLPEPPRDLNARVDLLRILASVSPRCRQILYSRFVEGASAAQIARDCSGSTSSDYGRRLVHRCLTAARAALAKKAGRA
ncbi:MAG TPA: sigma-70 family RNA polymerase sigma factor [Thermoanaerobaculia bacterium]|nr:sigma-70 family RNA polymerase sigma factor [Thermoanaerobaculia bacterium]